MNEAVIIASIAAITSIVGPYLAYKQSTKANAATTRNESLKLESGAYKRARDMYESGIAQLEEQLERLRKQVSEEQDISIKLRTQIYALQITVSRLRTELIRAGVEIPTEALSDEA